MCCCLWFLIRLSFEESAQQEWFGAIADVEALVVSTPSSSRPHISSLTCSTGSAFRALAESIAPGHRDFCRVTASLRSVPLKKGPLFYNSCPTVDARGGRICQKKVEVDGFCSRCNVCVEAVPFLHLNQGSFISHDGSTFMLSALGLVAERLLGFSAARAALLEQASVDSSDALRSNQQTAILPALACDFDLAIVVEKMVIDDDAPVAQATIYDIAEASAAPSATGAPAKRAEASAAPAATGPPAKRARH